MKVSVHMIKSLDYENPRNFYNLENPLPYGTAHDSLSTTTKY